MSNNHYEDKFEEIYQEHFKGLSVLKDQTMKATCKVFFAEGLDYSVKETKKSLQKMLDADK